MCFDNLAASATWKMLNQSAREDVPVLTLVFLVTSTFKTQRLVKYIAQFPTTFHEIYFSFTPRLLDQSLFILRPSLSADSTVSAKIIRVHLAIIEPAKTPVMLADKTQRINANFQQGCSGEVPPVAEKSSRVQTLSEVSNGCVFPECQSS